MTAEQRTAAQCSATDSGSARYFATDVRDVKAEFMLIVMLQVSRLKSSLVALSCPILSCAVLSCPVLSCPALSCPVLSCPDQSCLVLSCPVLSCYDYITKKRNFYTYYYVVFCILLLLSRALLCYYPKHSSQNTPSICFSLPVKIVFHIKVKPEYTKRNY
jgi:hypothetical protein